MVAAGFSQKALAPAVNMSKNSLNAKINGRKKLNTDEVARICDVLGIDSPEVKCLIFLRQNSQKRDNSVSNNYPLGLDKEDA